MPILRKSGDFMGILSGLFRSRDKPKNSTSGSGYRFFYGQSSAGKCVTERSAMQMTAVYACVRILSEAVAGLPLHLYKYNSNGSKEKAVEHPLYFLLHDEPNPEMTSFVFRETLMTHLLLWGNAYAQIIRNGKGDVVALYPLMPNRMSVDRDKNGNLYYQYNTSSDDARTMKGATVRLSPYQVLHIAGLGFDGLVGYSPIAMAKNAIGLAIAAEEYGSKFYANGASPSGVLEHPGTLKDPSKVRDSWNAAFVGSGNSHRVAVLEEGLKYTLEPWIVRWEQSISRSLLSRSEKSSYFVKFNVDGLLRGDYASRMSGYATARQNGWMSANDIRELENLDRIPTEKGGDLYLVNGNMLPLNNAGAFANINNNEEILEMDKSDREQSDRENFDS